MGHFVLALSCSDQQYYLDRIITDIDLYNQKYKLAFFLDRNFIVNYPHQNLIGHKFHPFLLPEHLTNRSYCEKLRNQFNIYYKERAEAQRELQQKLKEEAIDRAELESIRKAITNQNSKKSEDSEVHPAIPTFKRLRRNCN